MPSLAEVKIQKKNKLNIKTLETICNQLTKVLNEIDTGTTPNRQYIEDSLYSCKEIYVSLLLEEVKYKHEQNKARLKYIIECPSCRHTHYYKTRSCKKCGHTFNSDELLNAEQEFRSKKYREEEAFETEISKVKNILQ
ncbi:MAG: hypothetical protein K5750_04185 [Eubacterium sp.]|nr:hypothetical protein [Eubacterium sp.]